MGKREKERERKGGLGMPKEKGGEGENVRDKTIQFGWFMSI